MRKLNKRVWLNNKESSSTGFIIAKVSYNKRTEDTEVTLTLGDCARVVNLDFEFYDKRGREEIKHKTITFQNTINEFCNTLLDHIEELEKNK